MFEIDLRKGAREPGAAEAISEEAVSFVPVAGGLLVLIAVLWGVGSWLDSSIATRRDEVTRLEQLVSSHRQQLAEISGRRRALLDLDQQEVYWSDQLRLLSRQLPDKLWLSKVAVETSGGTKEQPPSRRLRIQGGFLAHSSEGNLDLVGKFVEALEGDARFGENFANLRLESVKRAGGDGNALAFELSAQFRS